MFEFVFDDYIKVEVEGIKYNIRIKQKEFGIIDFFVKGRSGFFYHNRSGNIFVFTTLFQLSFSMIFVDLLIRFSLWYVGSLKLSPDNNVEVSPFFFATFVLVTFGSIFWHEREGYYRKWEYISSRYRDFNFENSDINKKRSKFVDFLHDLHIMNLWSHTTYRYIVADFIVRMGELRESKLIHSVEYSDFEDFIYTYESKYIDKTKLTTLYS